MKRTLAALWIATLAVAPFGDALAGEPKEPVRLSIRAEDNTVSSDSTIVIKGRADSDKRACRRNRPVTLYVDGNPVGTDQTSRKGAYRFDFPGPHPAGPHKFETKIAGNARCKASRPNTVTVTVS